MDALIVLAFVIGYVLLSWAVLSGGAGQTESVPSRGRHRRDDAPELIRATIEIHAPQAVMSVPVLFLADRTSPSESLRGRCEVDTPIFATLAKELGLDQMLVAA